VGVHGEEDVPGVVEDVPEEVGEDEGLVLADEGFGSCQVLVLLALHEILDDLLSLVEVVQVPVAVVVQQWLLQLQQHRLAPPHLIIIDIALLLDVYRKQALPLRHHPDVALRVIEVGGDGHLAVGAVEDVVILKLLLLELRLVLIGLVEEVVLV
jgi:hypothetical protein